MLYIRGVNSDEGVKLVGDHILLMLSVIDFCKTLPGALPGRPFYVELGRSRADTAVLRSDRKVLGWRKEVNTLALEWIGSPWSSLTACH
jgi:hypothetical protein